MRSILRAGCAIAAAIHVACANAQPAPDVRAEPIVVTATRTARSPADVPASVDAIGAESIHDQQLQVNLSETLPALAGVVANNRQNYAQDLQISIRGFGARSTFGVRGLRILVDGIPATLPDGQGQVSHIDLASAGRVEVLRGPFSVLYGNASGGVINVFTETPKPGFHAGAAAMAASFDTWRVAGLASGGNDALAYTLSAGYFETDGYRDHSAANRTTGNAVLRWDLASATSLTFVANAVDMPGTQD